MKRDKFGERLSHLKGLTILCNFNAFVLLIVTFIELRGRSSNGPLLLISLVFVVTGAGFQCVRLQLRDLRRALDEKV
jgi:hypothetical protein